VVCDWDWLVEFEKGVGSTWVGVNEVNSVPLSGHERLGHWEVNLEVLVTFVKWGIGWRTLGWWGKSHCGRCTVMVSGSYLQPLLWR